MMVDFVAHKFDVLVATTIVENGLDIPNANTIIINRADRYGLAQLYQLRGRVGRSDRPGLRVPADSAGADAVADRPQASRGDSGVQRPRQRVPDRGARPRDPRRRQPARRPAERSDRSRGLRHVLKLLEQTIRELKGEDLDDERRAVVNLRIDLRIDEHYIPDMNQRLMVYRRLARATTLDEVDALCSRSFAIAMGRPHAPWRTSRNTRGSGCSPTRFGLESLDREGAVVVLKFRQDAKIDGIWIMKMIQNRGDLTMVPPAALKLDLTKPVERPKQAPQEVKQAVPPAGRLKPKATGWVKPPDTPPARESWWTTRATSGEVSGGFTRDEILAEVPPDPRAPGGLFERVRHVLDELSRGLTG